MTSRSERAAQEWPGTYTKAENVAKQRLDAEVIKGQEQGVHLTTFVTHKERIRELLDRFPAHLAFTRNDEANLPRICDHLARRQKARCQLSYSIRAPLGNVEPNTTTRTPAPVPQARQALLQPTSSRRTVGSDRPQRTPLRNTNDPEVEADYSASFPVVASYVTIDETSVRDSKRRKRQHQDDEVEVEVETSSHSPSRSPNSSSKQSLPLWRSYASAETLPPAVGEDGGPKTSTKFDPERHSPFLGLEIRCCYTDGCRSRGKVDRVETSALLYPPNLGKRFRKLQSMPTLEPRSQTPVLRSVDPYLIRCGYQVLDCVILHQSFSQVRVHLSSFTDLASTGVPLEEIGAIRVGYIDQGAKIET